MQESRARAECMRVLSLPVSLVDRMAVCNISLLPGQQSIVCIFHALTQLEWWIPQIIQHIKLEQIILLLHYAANKFNAV